MFLGIEMADPCPGAPAIATTLGPTTRAYLDGGFDTSERWDVIAPGVRMAAGLAGEPTCGPGRSCCSTPHPGPRCCPSARSGRRPSWPRASGSIDVAGDRLAQGAVRVEEAGVDHPAVVAGPDGAQVVVIFADRRALRSAVSEATMAWAVGRRGRRRCSTTSSASCPSPATSTAERPRPPPVPPSPFGGDPAPCSSAPTSTTASAPGR